MMVSFPAAANLPLSCAVICAEARLHQPFAASAPVLSFTDASFGSTPMSTAIALHAAVTSASDAAATAERSPAACANALNDPLIDASTPKSTPVRSAPTLKSVQHRLLGLSGLSVLLQPFVSTGIATAVATSA